MQGRNEAEERGTLQGHRGNYKMARGRTHQHRHTHTCCLWVEPDTRALMHPSRRRRPEALVPDRLSRPAVPFGAKHSATDCMQHKSPLAYTCRGRPQIIALNGMSDADWQKLATSNWANMP